MLNLGGYDLEGPYSQSGLVNLPGVYVVLDIGRDNQIVGYIDVGESHQVRARVDGHDRAQCWNKNTSGTRAFAVLYTRNDDGGHRRRAIEQYLRVSLSPLCGDC